jgi:hypothetical protein
LATDASGGHGSLFGVELDGTLSGAVAAAPGQADAGWNLVEAFTDLRERQAEALRLTL